MQLREWKSQAGISLAELMIYLVLAGIVITLTMEMTRTTSISYVRGREVSKVQSNGRYAMALMARDIMNTGFKTMNDTTGGTYSYLQLPGTWTGDFTEIGTPPSDSAASFYFWPGNPTDTLEIFKAEMASADSLDKVIRARYFVDTATNIITRVSQEFDSLSLNNWKNPDTLSIASNVEAMQFRFSYDGVNWVDDPKGYRDDVVAIEISFLMRTDREVTGGGSPTSYSLGNITYNASTDANFLRRRYVEIVEVVNNGLLF